MTCLIQNRMKENQIMKKNLWIDVVGSVEEVELMKCKLYANNGTKVVRKLYIIYSGILLCNLY